MEQIELYHTLLLYLIATYEIAMPKQQYYNYHNIKKQRGTKRTGSY